MCSVQSVFFLEVFLKKQYPLSVLEGTLHTRKIILLVANAFVLTFILRCDKNLKYKITTDSSMDTNVSHLSSHLQQNQIR